MPLCLFTSMLHVLFTIPKFYVTIETFRVGLGSVRVVACSLEILESCYSYSLFDHFYSLGLFDLFSFFQTDLSWFHVV